MNHPIIALIGRVNVGKSTLFNRLVKKQQALVADFEGLTVDRQYGQGHLENFEYSIIDTGGFSQNTDQIQRYILEQIEIAIEEANIIFLVLEAQIGLSKQDLDIIEKIRALEKQVYLLVNKVDKLNEHQNDLLNEFYSCGIKNTFFISATTNKGCLDAIEHLRSQFKIHQSEELKKPKLSHPLIGCIGKPNAGKSTLINQLLGQNRMVTSDIPGTTREAVFNTFEYQNKAYTLIDTPGVRKKRKVRFWVERLSISSAIKIIYQCDVVLLLIDATEGVTEQDINLINLSIYHEKEVVILLNKKDLLNEQSRYHLNYSLDKKLAHLQYVVRLSICALSSDGVSRIFNIINQLLDARQMSFPTHRINQIMKEAVFKNPPLVYKNKIIKLKYAHQASMEQKEKKHPLQFMIHGNNVKCLPDQYKRYLNHFFRRALNIPHNLINIQFKNNLNPYLDKK